MGKLFVLAITLGLLVFPSVNYGQPQPAASESPPIAQPLIREGDFALRLVGALKIGSPTSEPEAESMLSAVGIAPKNGWIADYPVTPVTISELRRAVAEAADSNQLAMTRDEALGAFKNLLGKLGLLVVSETSENQWNYEPPKEYPDYVAPGVVNNYYYNQGPPVVTYFLPPPKYYYLYSWVPYPFWYSGFFFCGFFILSDFNKMIIVERGKTVVSNHVFYPKIRRYFSLGPDKRFKKHRGILSFRARRKIHKWRGFRSPRERRKAHWIRNRNHRHHPTYLSTGLPPHKSKGTLGRGSTTGVLSSESRGRGRSTGRGHVLDRRQVRSGRSGTIDRVRNLGTHREKAQIRRGGTVSILLQPQWRNGARRAFNATPHGKPSRTFRTPYSRARRSAGRSRGMGFSARGGGGQAGARRGRF